jgi:hypothetical protein
MSECSRLDYSRVGNVLTVRPLIRLLGPWDGSDEPPAETLEFRDQFQHLLGAAAGPLLLDLRGFEFARNWNWFLVPLSRDCLGQGRRLAACVRPEVAEVFAVTKLDRLLPIRAVFEEALAALSQEVDRAKTCAAPGRASAGDRLT